MSYSVKPGNIFGRIGTGIGKGLAEQLPKEIERGRLSAGLKELEGQKDLSPFQQFSRLAAIPGITPQMIQSGSDLLRQQARGQALAHQQSMQNQPRPSPFPTQTNKGTPTNLPPSITKGNILERVQEGYIPPTQDEIFEEAGRRYNENPALYGNDPNKAIEAAEVAASREQAINEAYTKQHEKLSHIQDNVVQRLKQQSDRLGVQIPNDTYSTIEDEAVQATKPKKDGGQGLTEQQAMKKYGKKLDDISRQYAKIGEITGGWAITGRSPSNTLRSLKGLQKEFAERKDTNNLALNLISDASITPKLAYSIAQPIYDVPEANKILKELPKLPTLKPLSKFIPLTTEETLEASEKLAPLLSKYENLSPLAIAYELEKKGYDPDAWLQYVTDNKKKLNLRERQANQLDTPNNLFEPWNDWWLRAFTGIE